MRGCRSTREGRGRRTVAVALALAAANLGGPGLAFGAEDLPAFGMIGLAQRQTAVLNLVLVNPTAPGTWSRRPSC
jgi:Mrp family chromosome partitioning ATPase